MIPVRFTSIFMALIGLAVAGGSAYAARDYLETQTAAASEDLAVVQVVAAARDIPFGQPIEGHMLTSISWPRDAVPPGVFTNFEVLLSGPSGEPRRARRAISQGELLLASKVSEFGEKVTIVQTLSPNNRAMAISVNAETSVGGFVTPGDYVDVMLILDDGAGLQAKTILQNIRVIGVDQDANERKDTPGIARTVTVEVTPEQSQTLALAQNAGRLSLTLGNRLGEEETAPLLESTRLSDLMFDDVRPVVADGEEQVVEQRTREITVRRGNVASTVQLR